MDDDKKNDKVRKGGKTAFELWLESATPAEVDELLNRAANREPGLAQQAIEAHPEASEEASRALKGLDFVRWMHELSLQPDDRYEVLDAATWNSYWKATEGSSKPTHSNRRKRKPRR